MSEGLTAQVEAAANASGLVVLSAEGGEGLGGVATKKFTLALRLDPAKTELLELSAGLDLGRADLMADVKTYMAEWAKRLKNPRPDCYVTLQGLPVSFGGFGWPFHASTSGADTSLVHGEVRLEDGATDEGVPSGLHAKVAVSMTVTFREAVVPAPEQPFAESFILNAVRKTLDQGQLELVKSGNRQPVMLTTRYYSAKQKKFVFNDTAEEQRKGFLAAKAFWLSGVLGAGGPVWLEDPRDAQYLDTSPEDLGGLANVLMAEGLLAAGGDRGYASATEKLMGLRESSVGEMKRALEFTKPKFNEEMRSGLTNM